MKDYLANFGHESKTCVFAFASGDCTKFEWQGTLDRLEVDYILFRDHTDRWYTQGVAGIGILGIVVNYIRLVSFQYNRCFTLGLSKGAYAALKYGYLAKIKEIIAISPVTGLSYETYSDFDPRWHHRLEHVRTDYKIEDLKPLFRSHAHEPIVHAFISDGDGAELDYKMCTRIGVEPTLIPGYSHEALGAAVRDRGLVEEIIWGK